MGLLGLVTCTWTVDLDPLGNNQCPKGTKLCDGQCVSFLVENGCAREGCAPCVLANAVARCGSAGECAIGSCQGC
jgi:hypothetical protein